VTKTHAPRRRQAIATPRRHVQKLPSLRVAAGIGSTLSACLTYLVVFSDVAT